MAPTRRQFLGAATASSVAGLAGCGSDSGGDGSGGDTPTSTPTPTPEGVAVEVANHPDYGDILVDGDGMTLYMFDSDTQGDLASTCTGGCADAWPPLTTQAEPTAGNGVTADLETFERDDGGTQVAANGWPLYYFRDDEAAGDATGQGVNDVWWVLGPDGTPKRPTQASLQVRDHPEYGEILVDGDGMTLYMFDSDTRGDLASTCTEGCAEAWPPFTTAGQPTAGDGVTADVEVFEREDGSVQVAANGWPLYYFRDDEAAGDATGQGVNDVWWVLGPDGTPKRPTQASVQVRSHPDYGDILVDGDGLTLYMFDRDERGADESACTDSCVTPWPPLTTDEAPAAGDAVDAELTTFERDDGSTQVAANGWPLYYFGSDSEPGDAAGQGASGVWWVLNPSGAPIRSDTSTPTPTETASDEDGISY